MQVLSNICTKEQESGSWDDLPQDILILILNKLYFADQIRFRAVSKSCRRIPKDVIRCSDYLPWITNHLRITALKDVHPFRCELFDPYSQKMHRVPKSKYGYGRIHIDNFHPITVYASKYGWLLLSSEISVDDAFCLGQRRGYDTSWLFLHNPFTNDFISLPYLSFGVEAATFTMDPTCPECECLALSWKPKDGAFGDIDLYLYRCCLARDKVWSKKYLETIRLIESYSVCYMNGELYCLLQGGKLKSYNFTEDSWKLVTQSLPEPYKPSMKCYSRDKYWLIENERKLMLVWGKYDNGIREWLVFRMDWSNMSWVIETNLKNVAFFISANVSLMAPLADDNGKLIEDCRVFYPGEEFDNYDDDGYYHRIKCYSLQEKEPILSKEYSSWLSKVFGKISFIQPPNHVRN